jgi:hypothetical protein
LRIRLPGQDEHRSILLKSGEQAGKYNNSRFGFAFQPEVDRVAADIE